MRPIYRIIIIIIVLLVAAAICIYFEARRVAPFKIVNNSGVTIDTLIVTNGTDRYTEYEVKQGDTVHDKLVFSSEAVHEGLFTIKTYKNGIEKNKSFWGFKGKPKGEIYGEITKDSIYAHCGSDYQ